MTACIATSYETLAAMLAEVVGSYRNHLAALDGCTQSAISELLGDADAVLAGAGRGNGCDGVVAVLSMLCEVVENYRIDQLHLEAGVQNHINRLLVRAEALIERIGRSRRGTVKQRARCRKTSAPGACAA